MCRSIEALFPHGLMHVVVADEAMYRTSLFPEEEASVRLAVPSRRREFSAGRAAARSALSRMGVGGSAIPAGSDRAPVWPSGIVGSISHSRGLCVAAVGWEEEVRGAGLDVEDITAIPPLLAAQICGAEDLAHAPGLSADLAPLLPNIVFSAKEAFYKAYYPLTRRFLEFHDVTVALLQEGRSHGAFTVRPCRAELPLANDFAHFEGRWRIHPPVLLAGAILRAGRPGDEI